MDYACEICKDEVAHLKAEVERLKEQVTAVKRDNEYWVNQYQVESARYEAQAKAYLNVVRVLGGRE